MSYIRIERDMVPRVHRFLVENTGKNAKMAWMWEDKPEDMSHQTLVCSTHYMFKVNSFLDGWKAAKEDTRARQEKAVEAIERDARDPFQGPTVTS